MKSKVTEIEVRLSESEQETITEAYELAGYMVPELNNVHINPNLGNWQMALETAMRENDLSQSKRTDMLQLRKEIKDIKKKR